MRPIKIISGGQTGADQGGLIAGKALCIKTGGTAPWDWMTEEGPKRDELQEFGLVPGPFDPCTYPMRTRINVFAAQGTVLFGNPNSPGSRITVRYCKEVAEPYIINPSAQELREWAEDNNIEILNVAGNRESKNPGIRDRVANILIEAFKE